jgi:predicted RNase H-like HicB family nuclease
MRDFTAYIELDKHSGLYIGTVPGVHGAHTAAETLDELVKKLREVTELCLEELGEGTDDLPEFIGTQRITVGV